MKALSESKHLKIGVILSYISLIISIIGTILVSNHILNYVGDYNYGLYSFANSITNWLTVISSALCASFLRFATLESKSQNGNTSKINYLYLVLLLLIGAFVLIVGLATVLSLYFFKTNLFDYSWQDSRKVYLVFVFSILNISMAMPASIFSLYITFKKKFIFAKLVSICSTIITFIGNFFIAFFTQNIIFISLFTIFITTLNFAVNYFYCKKTLRISFCKVALKDNKSLLKSICIFSSILLVNSIVDQINSNMDKTLLGIFGMPENVTIYQFGHQFVIYLLTMSTAISSVFAPTINQLVINHKDEQLNALFEKISHIQLIVICFVTFGFCATGDSFIKWWLGDSRLGVYYVGSILMVVNICPLSMNSSIEIQRARNKHLFRAVVYFGLAILNVGLSILFLNIFSNDKALIACLLGTVISIFISHWLLMNLYNKKEMKLPVDKYIFDLLKYCFIGLMSLSIVLLINYVFVNNFIESNFLSFVVKGSLFVIFYLIIAIVMDFNFIVTHFKNLIRKKQIESEGIIGGDN